MAQRGVEIIVERESANDVDATVVEVFFTSGAAVKQGDRIFDIETSKAVQEIHAAANGLLVHSLKVGDTIALGGAIARIVPEGAETLVPSPSPASAPQAAPRAGGARQVTPRLSREAAALAAQHGLSAADFDRDLVTTADVRRRISTAATSNTEPVPPLTAPIEDLRPPGAELVASHKQAEINLLSRGAGASMLSVVGATVGFGELMREGEGFFAAKIIDIVAYEASRLMKTYPRLNAAWRDGYVEHHAVVNAGVAFDSGGRLVVYGVENADTLDLEDLQDEILGGFMKFSRNKLTARELSRATFTITDLSATGIDYVLPLLPQGQSCILGITNGGGRGFALHMGFDHRVTEGLNASRFLTELRDRIVATLETTRQPS
jgi:pyruvate/2-oxoglutarate dehydrogenase complex dihydrolipoamide acyltransferase (E2) component